MLLSATSPKHVASSSPSQKSEIIDDHDDKDSLDQQMDQKLKKRGHKLAY